MTPAELRSRIARSGISGKRLARLLGIPQPNVSGWCTGIRSIPAHHVARIIELTDNPPLRTEPPWRPPADMPPSRHGRTIRAKRPQPLRQLAGFRGRKRQQRPSTLLTGRCRRRVGNAGPLPVANISLYQPPAVRQPAPQRPRQVKATMTGPLHADFVAEHNKAQQEPAPHTRTPNQRRPLTATACVTHYTYGIPLIDKQR